MSANDGAATADASARAHHAAPDVTTVVPVHGAAHCLEQLVGRIEATLSDSGRTFEIVLVNDASPDDAWRVITHLAAAYGNVRGIDLLGNHGQARATLCGMSEAQGRIVITMDDDLEHPPEELPRLIAALDDDDGLDAVVGSWSPDRGVMRNLGTRFYSWVQHRVYGAPPRFHHTAFRAMRRSVSDAMLAHETRMPILSILLWGVTRQVANVTVAHDRDADGSSFTLRQAIRTIFRNFLRGSTLPLRFLSLFGVGAALFAAVLGTYFFVRWLVGVQTAPGWVSVFLVTTFFGGAALLGLGLIGEYLALIMEEVRRPPRWRVRRGVSDGGTVLRADSNKAGSLSR